MGRGSLLIVRWGIFLLACGFLYTRMVGPKGIVALVDQLPALDLSYVFVGSVLLLMVLNWALEASKWWLLLRPVERLPFARAFMATIAGTSVGLITINRTGEFLGRILFLSPENRASGAFASALGSIAQFLVTLVLGSIGLIVLLLSDNALPWAEQWVTLAVVMLAALVAVIATTFYLFPRFLRQLLLLIPFLSRLEKASAVLGEYQQSELLRVLFLSLVRYGVFTFQYVLVLWSVQADVYWGALFVAVPVIYLLATLIPSIMLTELGVRGSVAVAVLGPLGANEAAVLLGTTVLWSINVAFPAIVGSVFMLLMRIRTKAESR